MKRKPTLRFTRAGWRWKWDFRHATERGIEGGIAYVGPYATAREAFLEALP